MDSCPNHMHIPAAVKAGHLQCVKRMVEASPETYSFHCMHEAMRGGDMAIVRYLVDRYPWTDSLPFALQHGHLHLLEFACAQGYDFQNAWLTVAPATLECLQYVVDRGAPWHESAMLVALSHGKLDCVQYMHERGVAWSPMTTALGADDAECLACLQYAYERGAPWKSTALIDTVRHGHAKCLAYAYARSESSWNGAIEVAGSVECLQFALDHGARFGPTATRYATEQGVTPLKMLHAHGCDLTPDCIAAALKRKRMDCLTYLHEQGVPWPDDVLSIALNVVAGSVECLRYVWEHNDGSLRWPYGGLYDAVRFNSYECLKYAHEHGAQLDVSDAVFTLQAAGEDPRILRYLHEHGAPFHPQTLNGTLWQLENMKYAYERGAERVACNV